MRVRDYSIRPLHNAMRRKRAAEKAIADILQKDFPPGTRLHFEGARSIVYSAEVTMNGYDDRLKVLNHHTGRERWIDAWRIHPTPSASR